MGIFRLDWFLAVLAAELWVMAAVVTWGPEVLAHWRARRQLAREYAAMRAAAKRPRAPDQPGRAA